MKEKYYVSIPSARYSMLLKWCALMRARLKITLWIEVESFQNEYQNKYLSIKKVCLFVCNRDHPHRSDALRLPSTGACGRYGTPCWIWLQEKLRISKILKKLG